MPLTTSNARELVFDRGNQSARYNDFDVQGVFMPFIQVHLAAGRSEEQKRALLLAISAAVQSSIGAPAESVRVWISEFRREEFVVAGRIASDDQLVQRDGA
jgi:4-oxalocrotonate tautomerase